MDGVLKSTHSREVTGRPANCEGHLGLVLFYVEEGEEDVKQCSSSSASILWRSLSFENVEDLLSW